MALFELNPTHIDALPRNYEQYILSDQELLARTQELVASSEPYIFEGKVFDDGVIAGMSSDSAVYLVDGKDKLADIARTLEARVEAEDINWLQDPLSTARYHENIEEGSEFFIYVDGVRSETPKVVGSMRIMQLRDGVHGAAEANFEIGYHAVAPAELRRKNEKEKVIDVADIVVSPEYRIGDKKVSSWLNHCLGRISREREIDRWISCINDNEAKLLATVGINFEQIGDYAVEYDGDGTNYRFYQADPRQVYREVELFAMEMLNKKGVKRAIGDRALIGRYGVAAKEFASYVNSLHEVK